VKKYDVLILCRFFKPDQIIAADLAYETATDLLKKGLRVTIVCGKTKTRHVGKEVPLEEIIDDVEVKRLNYLQFPKSSKVGRIASYLTFVFAVLFNWRVLRQTKCIIVYSDPPILPVIVALNKKIFKVNFIFVSYDIFPDIPIATKHVKEKSIACQMMRASNDFVDKNVDKIVALSNDMKSHILNSRKYISADRITVIPNWSTLDTVNSSKEIRNNEIKALREQFEIIVLYSGNMGIAHDMDTILGAAKQLRNNENILFIFAGTGQKADQVKAEIDNSRLTNVRLYGYLEGQDYIDILRVADVHVISLIGGIAGMIVPSKTYSYMSIGRPLIAIMPDHTDIAIDINNYELGCVVEANDVDKFVNYVTYLLKNKDEVSRIGNRVLEVFNAKYTRKSSTMKYYELVKDIVD